MAAGVTEVIVEKDQDDTPANATVTNEADLTKKPDKKETKALAHQNGNKKSKWLKKNYSLQPNHKTNQPIRKNKTNKSRIHPEYHYHKLVHVRFVW